MRALAIVGGVIAAALIYVCFATSEAKSQPACSDAESILRILKDNYGETPVWEGLSPAGIHIITRSDSGSWSLVLVQGVTACLVIGGPASATFEPVGEPV